MEKKAAIEKINKLLVLASNAGAAEGEKANALELARKLASKHGLKIVERANVQETSEEKVYFWSPMVHIPYFDFKIFASIVHSLNIQVRVNKAEKSVSFYDMTASQIKMFIKVYTNFYKKYVADLKAAKQSFPSTWTRTATKIFRFYYLEGFYDKLHGKLNNKDWDCAYSLGYASAVPFIPYKRFN